MSAHYNENMKIYVNFKWINAAYIRILWHPQNEGREIIKIEFFKVNIFWLMLNAILIIYYDIMIS